MKRTVLFVSESSGYIVDLKYAGIHDYACRHGWNTRRIVGQPFDIAELVSCWKPHGLIADQMATMSAGLPTVLLDSDAPAGKPYHRVDIDLVESARLAGAEFLRLGLRNLAWIPPAEEHPWSFRRREHFESFARERALPMLCFTGKARNGKETPRYLRTLGDWVERLPRPCGVFAANDATAELLLTVCSLRKIKVPQDLAVIGVDDNPIRCEAMTPTLTSITPAFRESGFAAAEMLDALMNGRTDVPNRVMGATGLSRRGTTQRSYGRLTDIQRARNLIRERACNGLKPRDVFAVMNGSVRNAQIRFRAETGKTVRDEIEHIRMEKARRLLRTTDKPISEIAELCGYATDSFLCDAFKRTAGCTMGTWRKAHSREAE